MPILVPLDIKLIDDITLCDSGDVSNCTHPAGHCFGSDGGSGIPENLKVPPGQGGDQEVWTLNAQKNKILNKAVYEKCQYCGKFNFSRDVKEE